MTEEFALEKGAIDESTFMEVPRRRRPSSFRVHDVTTRVILNSQGGRSFEADVHVDGGIGRASTPRAIVAGRREQKLSKLSTGGGVREIECIKSAVRSLEGKHFATQREFDQQFAPLGCLAGLGSDVSLALSLAFCRASAKAQNLSLCGHLSTLVGRAPAVPNPIVNVFSGGVHGGNIPFQQLMIIPRNDCFSDDLEAGVLVYGEIEKLIKINDQLVGYSSSSGMLTKISDLEKLFDILSDTLVRLGLTDCVSLGTDVAAEHLECGEGLYRLHHDQKPVTLDELAAYHRKLLKTYNFDFYEDPFGPDDDHHWRDLTRDVKHDTMIVGDDLFATNSENIDVGLATGILLKMNQIGTVSGTLEAAQVARASGMELCVSHRSKETEDTGICDLAVALGADLIKIGGPRRGDRTGKYNQLLRLSQQLPLSSSGLNSTSDWVRRVLR